jgi:hypothetical protein
MNGKSDQFKFQFGRFFASLRMVKFLISRCILFLFERMFKERFGISMPTGRFFVRLSENYSIFERSRFGDFRGFFGSEFEKKGFSGY